MSIFAKGLVAAMEDETQAAELAIDEAGADSAEADIVEATDISADVEAGTAEVEQASADVAARFVGLCGALQLCGALAGPGHARAACGRGVAVARPSRTGAL